MLLLLLLLEQEALREIPPKTVRELASTGSLENVRVEQAEQGLVITFNVVGSGLENKRVLGQARGGVRYFHSFDGAASVLQSMSVMEFTACTAGWMPRTTKGTAPAPAPTPEKDQQNILITDHSF